MIEACLGGRAHLAITDNRHNLVSTSRSDGVVKVRVHHVFLEAEPRVLRALTQFVRRPTPRTRHVLREFVSGRLDVIRRKPPQRRRVLLRPRGRCFDLEEILSGVCAEHGLDGRKPHITWGRESAARVRSIKFGSYDRRVNVIRVHPALDVDWVPRCFVEYIVYHELLHAHQEEKRDASGRRVLHDALFRRQERRFVRYEQARAWEKANIRRFLRGRGRR